MSSLFVKWGKRISETEMLARQDLQKDAMERRRRALREEAEARRAIDLSWQWREPSREAVKRRADLEAGEGTTVLGGSPFYPEKRR